MAIRSCAVVVYEGVVCAVVANDVVANEVVVYGVVEGGSSVCGSA